GWRQFKQKIKWYSISHKTGSLLAQLNKLNRYLNGLPKKFEKLQPPFDMAALNQSLLQLVDQFPVLSIHDRFDATITDIDHLITEFVGNRQNQTIRDRLRGQLTQLHDDIHKFSYRLDLIDFQKGRHQAT